MICGIAQLDDSNIVVNVITSDSDNWGHFDTYDETNQAMRDWYANLLPDVDVSKLYLLFTGELCAINDMYDDSTLSPARFKESNPYADPMPEDVGMYDAEYGRWWPYVPDGNGGFVWGKEYFTKDLPRVRNTSSTTTSYSTDSFDGELGPADPNYDGPIAWF
jgi:hypothetical protein